MPPDGKSRAESAPYVPTEDEFLDDHYDYESEPFEQRYGSPLTSHRRSTEVGGTNTDRGYLTPTNLIAMAVAMAVGFWAVTSDVFVSSAANVSGATDVSGAANTSGTAGNGGAGNFAVLSIGEPPPFPVTVQVSQAVRHDQALIVRGRTEASARVAIKSETVGVVEAITATKGTPVVKGDVLCSLQRGSRDAALAEANAQLARARLDHDASTQLGDRDAAAKLALAGNKASLDAAEAAVKKAEIELGRTRISAPFSGIVEEQPAKGGELVTVGSVCAVLIAPDPVFIVGAVTERDVGRLRAGMDGTAQLVTGEKVSGAIRFVGGAAEPSTRTFRIEMEVSNPDGRLRDGVTATMRIPLKGEAAHRLPHSALTLNDAGQLGVRIIEQGDTAQFRPVKVLTDERGGVWVGGLPRDITVIVAGQDFVTDGQRVGPVDRRAAPRP